MPQKMDRLKVLLLSSQEPSTDLLREILSRRVLLATAWNREELFHLLRTGRYDVFLCDWEFRGSDWKEVCSEIRQYDPDLPAIVVCRLAGEQEWIEVLEAGCFDILSVPYFDYLVLAVLEQAVASREALSRRTAA
ncbi:MAG: hypothetical protein A3G20_03605 [Acidobacteria bacterium RIFCSPLOWO2_12_FULL_59_11]|nr:MAG: hypothetical protein A3G20_03605 [Acidobacteria bacterium RIFCSPLOWO2_12_FULL_59_11]